MPEPFPAARTLPPKAVLAGPGDPTSLENVNGQQLPDGAICFVVDQASFYYFAKDSTDSPSGTDIIATVQGTAVPGRWIAYPSAGGASRALSGAVFVDGGTTTPTGNQNGAIASPFLTIAQALLTGDQQILLGAGDYSAESPLSLTGSVSLMAFPAVVPTAGPGCTSFIFVVLGTVVGTLSIGYTLQGVLCPSFDGSGASPNAGLIADNCTFQSIVCGDLNLTNTTMAIFTGDPTIDMTNSSSQAAVKCQNCSLQNASVQCASDNSFLYMCDMAAGFSFTFTGSPGTLTVDAYTAKRLSNLSITPTNGSIVVIA